ncbi:MAG: DUF4465 domain-containing protein [Bacteroidia bacterium]|nr:DUF4465 domain-containing protein [Bacteroidia bacterium]
MKKQILLLALLITVGLMLNAQTKAGFDDITLSSNSVKNGSGATVNAQFTSGNVEFGNIYQTSFGGFWSGGWAYSNIKNDTNGTYSNLYAAYANQGANNSANYAVAQQGSILRIKGADAGETVNGLYVTNGTYPALTIKNGDSFSKKFGGVNGTDPDFFVLIVKGWKSGTLVNDSVSFYLADYRSNDPALDYIIKDWTWVDLSILGGVDSLQFMLNSSDAGQFGINTPTFFCVDNIITKSDTADLENLSLANNKFWSKPNKSITEIYQSGNALFSSRYSISSFGDYWSGGFAISNKTDANLDSTVVGSSKINTAVTAMGADSTANYAIAQQNTIIRLTGNALGKQVEGAYFTNSNYSYASMKWGDAFARKFNDSDFFKLNIIGYKSGAITDSVPFYLAQNGVIKTSWTWVDLKPLGDVDSVMFKLSSSDVGQFGMNTPAFFAIDEFTTRDARVGLTNIAQTLQTSIYPNPTNGLLTINLPQQNTNASVAVYDVTGKLWIAHNMQNMAQIDLTNMPSGVYFVRVSSNGLSNIQRVVKY